MEILGIDIGGSGIKGAPVDVNTGQLMASRVRIPTPEGAKPKAVADVVAELAGGFQWNGPIGCGFPSVVLDGVVMTAANIHQKWVGVNANELFQTATHCPVKVLNDADVAGVAEMAYGAGRGRDGVTLMITIGTGLGSALFVDGKLVPNTEFGHMKIRGKDAETRASDAVRKLRHLSWKSWAKRFNEFLAEMEKLFWPNLIILGGGVIKEYQEFFPYLETRAELVPAQLKNEAGIVGAAMAAQSLLS